MRYVHKVLRLADVIEHLCRAQDELTSAGYEEWGREVGELLEAIDLEIGWLQTAGAGNQELL